MTQAAANLRTSRAIRLTCLTGCMRGPQNPKPETPHRELKRHCMMLVPLDLPGGPLYWNRSYSEEIARPATLNPKALYLKP